MNLLVFLGFLYNLIFGDYKTVVEMDYSIQTTWDNQSIKHEPVSFKFSLNDDSSLRIDVSAPFFNDPKPDRKPGDDFNLWDYEVTEVFFLADSKKYLELEFGPHGHWLVLLLDGSPSNVIKKGISLKYTAQITGDKWSGTAIIPEEYFPMKVTKFNAYAIHGVGDSRQYEALFPVPTGKYPTPSFHRLDPFKEIDMKTLLPANWNRTKESDLWN